MERKLINYAIQEEIGRGGMATVYRAVQESLNRVVAIKELDLSRFRSEPDVLERFRLEARAAAALEHPNIVTVFDLWEEEGKAFIAMEFVDGVELKDVLYNLGPVPYVSAVLIALAVSEALHYAHLRGMVHRDVKPGNIMLSEAGEIRLMDFGIVSVAGAGDLTVPGQILGTPAYMSPEQITGDEPGRGTDLFSLGAVLYEMIAGRKPFSGANHVALIQNVLHGKPIPLHEIDPVVPESVSSAVARCLEKDPGQRYGSVEEFSTVLEMILPLERPNLKSVVRELVARTVEQERTRLHSSAGEDERTSPVIRVPEVQGRPAESPGARRSGPGFDPAVKDLPVSPYDLEAEPPAELPPLEPDTELPAAGSHEPDKEAPPPQLALKDLPEIEEDTGHYVEETTVRKSGKPVIWLLMIILFLAAAALFRVTGGQKRANILKNAVRPLSKAHITITAAPAGKVFMDGELVGNASPDLSLEVEAGLHRLEVRHPDLGTRKFILELEPGEGKEIRVEFGNQ